MSEKRSMWAPLRETLRQARDWRSLADTPYGLTPVALIALGGFFEVFRGSAFQLAAPEIIRDLDFDLRTLTGIMAIVGFFLLFASLGIGWLADRRPRLPLFGVGTMLSGLAFIFTGRANGPAMLGVARVSDGVSSAAANVPAASLLADYYPPNTRGKVFAALGMVSRAAALIAPFPVGVLIITIGWRTTFAIFGAPIIVMGALALLLLKEPVRGYMERRAAGLDKDVASREDEPQSFGEAWRTVWAVRTLRRLFMADIWLTAGGFATSFFVLLLADKYGLNAFERGVVFVPAVVVGLLGGFIGGGLVDRLIARDPGRVLAALAIFGYGSAIGLLGIAAGPPLWAIVAFAAIFAFGGAMIGPAVGAIYTQVIPPTVRTQGMQMLSLATIPGLLLVFPLVGDVADRYGLQASLLVGVPFLLIGATIQLTGGSFVELDMRNATAVATAAQEWRLAREEGRGKLLVCRDVDVEYDGVQVLFDVDFDVDEGQILALLGTNGAGKSTLLRAIAGTQEASGGAIVFDGRDITHMPPHEVARRGVIYMPGGRGIFGGLTVRENILMGTWLVGREDRSGALAGVYELFPILEERAEELAASLSGGEQQMLSLAQAFLSRPRLLMIDELSLGLSPAVVAQLADAVRAIHDRGTTVIVVEQSVNVALHLADRAIFMEKGEVKFFGDTAELLRRPDILRAVYVKGSAAIGGAKGKRRRSLEPARTVLEVKSVHKDYGGITALDDVSFDVQEGRIVGIIGPNGAGKTTLFDVISGYQPADAGTVTLDGTDVTHLGPEARAELGLVRRFQDARLAPSLTVFENLLVALDPQLDVSNTLLLAVHAPSARRSDRRAKARAERLIEVLGLHAYRDKFVKELSTGLRRITDLACVLATKPKVLLLDEPSSGIAQAEAESLGPLIRRVRHETGCTMLVVEHDMALITGVSDELIAMVEGRVVTRGDPATVLEDPVVTEAYLGRGDAVGATARIGRKD